MKSDGCKGQNHTFYETSISAPAYAGQSLSAAMTIISVRPRHTYRSNHLKVLLPAEINGFPVEEPLEVGIQRRVTGHLTGQHQALSHVGVQAQRGDRDPGGFWGIKGGRTGKKAQSDVSPWPHHGALPVWFMLRRMVSRLFLTQRNWGGSVKANWLTSIQLYLHQHRMRKNIRVESKPVWCNKTLWGNIERNNKICLD